MSMQFWLNKLLERQSLCDAEMTGLMECIMAGEATQAQIGGALVALRMKGETVAEIAAAARVMRALATPVQIDAAYLVDTCGTGGDGAATFNISTAAAFVVAAAGGHVAKHGNRSVSSASGSADVLEAAGVNLDLTPDQVARCAVEVGVGFMFAPKHHGAMKHAIGPRRELGVRTIFNLLGPLTNPAGALNQVIGVYDHQWLVPVAKVLGALGSRHVLVVHAEDGLDEISISANTQVAELRNGKVTEYRVAPEQFGMSRAELATITAKSAAQSLELIRSVFANEPGPARDIVAMNAGAAIYAAGLADTLESGIHRAVETIAGGGPADKLARLVALSQTLAGEKG
ncbi:MAG: anthranilate phosphoribosyltransferase [Gammaproteobacteria bacterium]|nr:anthranilate phosphoribosyltransferase [Gammaproteobacteria bacterium]